MAPSSLCCKGGLSSSKLFQEAGHELIRSCTTRTTGTSSAAPHCRGSPGYQSDFAGGTFLKGASRGLQAKGFNADVVDQQIGFSGPSRDACRGRLQINGEIHSNLIGRNSRKPALGIVQRPRNWQRQESSGSWFESGDTGTEVQCVKAADGERATQAEPVESAPGDHRKHSKRLVGRQLETVNGRRGFLAASTVS